MKELSEEYGRILEEKRKEYAEYKEAKASMQDFLIARQNIEAILNSEAKARDEKKERGEQQKWSGQDKDLWGVIKGRFIDFLVDGTVIECYDSIRFF